MMPRHWFLLALAIATVATSATVSAMITCEKEFAVVVLVDKSTRQHLRAAQCTFLRSISATRVVYVTENQDEDVMPLSSLLSSSPACAEVLNKVTVAFSSSLIDVFEVLRVDYRSLVMDAKWILVVKPWTLVNFRNLCSYVCDLNARDIQNRLARLKWTSPDAVMALKLQWAARIKSPCAEKKSWNANDTLLGHNLWAEGEQSPVFIGHTSNSTTELAYLGSPPHISYEFGVLLRSVALLQVGWAQQHDIESFRSRSVRGNDFHPIEAKNADLTSILNHPPLRLLPTSRNDLFLSLPPVPLQETSVNAKAGEFFEGSNDFIPKAVAMGPLDPYAMMRLAQQLGFGCLYADTRIQDAKCRSNSDLWAHEEESSETTSAQNWKMRKITKKKSEMVLFAVLAREAKLEQMMTDTLSTWSSPRFSSASVYFMVSHFAMKGLGFRSRRDMFMDFKDSRPEMEQIRRLVVNENNAEKLPLSVDVSRRRLREDLTDDELTTENRIKELTRNNGLNIHHIEKVTRSKLVLVGTGKHSTTRSAAMGFRKYRNRAPGRDRKEAQLTSKDTQHRLKIRDAQNSLRAYRNTVGISDSSFDKTSNGYWSNESSPGIFNDDENDESMLTSGPDSSYLFGEIRQKIHQYQRTISNTNKSILSRDSPGGLGYNFKMPDDESTIVSTEFYRTYQKKILSQRKVVQQSERLCIGRDYEVGDNLAGPYSKRQIRVISLVLDRSMPGVDEMRTDNVRREKGSKSSSNTSFYDSAMEKPMAWSLWLRHKVSKVVQFFAEAKPTDNYRTTEENRFDMSGFNWFVIVDDDTYVRVPTLVHDVLPLHLNPSKWNIPGPIKRNVTNYDASKEETSIAIAVGRRFTCEKKNMALLGGGPGIYLSRGAVAAIRRAECAHLKFPIISRSVPGGDGWLGQCLEVAGVKLSHDWRLKSLPPYAYEPNIADHAVSFHKSNVRVVHGYLLSSFPSSTSLLHDSNRSYDLTGLNAKFQHDEWTFYGARLKYSFMQYFSQLRRPHSIKSTNDNNLISPLLCPPVLLRDQGKLYCLPLFTIIGAQKGGTTSLFSWLSQHPFVKPPSEKELNFYGNIWPIGFRKNRRVQPLSAFTFSYLNRFPLAEFMPTESSGAINSSSIYDLSLFETLLSLPSKTHQLNKSPMHLETSKLTEYFLRKFSALSMMQQEQILKEISKRTKEAALHVYGEASPDYLVSSTALSNMLRYASNMKVIVSLRDPVERALSAYFNKASDGTIHRHMQRLLYRKHVVDKRFDAEVLEEVRFLRLSGRHSEVTCYDSNEQKIEIDSTMKIRLRPCVPSILEVIEEMNETLALCPDHALHYTMAEKPSTLHDDDCYMPPFVLHGYYAKYLTPWMSAYGPAIVHSCGKSSFHSHHHTRMGSTRSSHLLVLDFADFAHEADTVMDTVSSFLGLPNFRFKTNIVYNTRDNRGVHKGTLSGIDKSRLENGGLGDWADTLLAKPLNKATTSAATMETSTKSKNALDKGSMETLRRYFEVPDAELQILLHGRQLSWMSGTNDRS